MSRKSKELIGLIVMVVAMTFFDPLDFVKDWDLFKVIVAALTYAVPCAVLTVLLSNLYCAIRKS